MESCLPSAKVNLPAKVAKVLMVNVMRLVS